MKTNDSRFRTNRLMVALTLMMACVLLSGCGDAEPSAEDITPYIVAEMDRCPVFTVSDVRVVDRMEREGTNVVDFKAKISLKWSIEEVWDLARTDLSTNLPCQYFLAMLRALSDPRELVPQYEATGVGVFARSERGWRLLEQLEMGFSPLAKASTSPALPDSSEKGPDANLDDEKQASAMAPLKPSAPVPALDACASKDNNHEEIECLGAVADAMHAAARQKLASAEYTRFEEAVTAGCDRVEEELMEMGTPSGTVIGRVQLSCAAEGWAAVLEKVSG